MMWFWNSFSWDFCVLWSSLGGLLGDVWGSLASFWGVSLESFSMDFQGVVEHRPRNAFGSHFRGIWERSWDILGRSWSVLGRSWGVLGCFGEALGAHRGHFLLAFREHTRAKCYETQRYMNTCFYDSFPYARFPFTCQERFLFSLFSVFFSLSMRADFEVAFH